MHPENVTQFMHSTRRPDLIVVRQPQRMAAMRGLGTEDTSGGIGWGRIFAWSVIGLGSAALAWIGLSLAFGGKGGGSMPPSRLEAQRARARQRAQRRAA